MEYLELEGLVKIQDNCDRKALNVLLKELDSTAFHGDGFIVTCTINQSLFMRGEGAISTSTTVIALLEKIRAYLVPQSTMAVSSIRWEVLIVLSHQAASQDCRYPLPLRQAAIQ